METKLTRKYKVLFLPLWFPGRTDSMSGLFVLYLAKAIQKYTASEITVFHVFPSDVKKTVRSWRNDGVEIYQVEIPKLPGMIGKIHFYLRFFVEIFKAYKEIVKHTGKPDISHVQVLTRMGLIAWVYKIFYGIPYIVTEHWSRYLPQNGTSYSGYLRQRLTRFVVRNSNGLFAVSGALLDAMRSHRLFHKNTGVISNSVDTDFFSPGEKTEPGFRFLHVSCFDEKTKNVKGILNVADRLRKEGFDFKFTFTGDGADWLDCRKYATNLSLDDNVIFTGTLQEHDLLKQYRNADVFVLFSYYETQGIVLMEALSCGVPVVTTHVGGIPDYINDSVGILVEPGDEEALFTSLKQIISGEITFSKNNLRGHALQICSEEKVALRYYSIYYGILDSQ